MAGDAAKMAAAVCCGFWVIVFIVLMAMSFKDIDADQQGLKYHGLSKSLTKDGDTVTVFDQGKHHVWPGQYFIKYFNRFDTLELTDGNAQTCLSRDGVVILTQIRILYKMVRNELADALFNFGEQDAVRKYVTRLAQDSIRDGCAEFKAEEFYANRRKIESTIADRFACATGCKRPVCLDPYTPPYVDDGGTCTRRCDAFPTTAAEPGGFCPHIEAGPIQFTNAKMPPLFEVAVTDKLKAKQDIDSARGPEREGSKLDATIALSVARITAEVDLKNATAQSEAIASAAIQEVEGIKADFEEKAKAWKFYKETNGLSVDQFLHGYFTALAMENSSLPVYTSAAAAAVSAAR